MSMGWRAALPLARQVYTESCVGCCLHIVLDDGNVRDGDVEFCVDRAREQQHPTCLALAELLLSMSQTQRLRLYNSNDYGGW